MAEEALWQARVIRMLLDALYEPRRGKRRPPKQAGSAPTALDVQRARNWLTDNTAEFRLTCMAAGFDPDFVRSAYLSGRITLDSLKNAGAADHLRGKGE
jgi:hypothetical protein